MQQLVPEDLVRLFGLPRGSHAVIHLITLETKETLFATINIDGDLLLDDADVTVALDTVSIRDRGFALNLTNKQLNSRGNNMFFDTTTGGLGFSETRSEFFAPPIDVWKRMLFTRSVTEDMRYTIDYSLGAGDMDWGILMANHVFKQIEFERSAGTEFYQMHDTVKNKRKVGIE